jgi:dTMP kinase
MGVEIKFIKMLNDFLLKDIVVNFTFLNLVNPKNMRERLFKRKKLNRYDKFNNSFYERVQNGFIKILKNNPRKYMKIDSNLNITDNKNLILNKIKKLI